MKYKIFTLAAVFAALSVLTSCSSGDEVSTNPSPVVAPNEVVAVPNEFCFFPDTPAANVEYRVIRKVKVGKGTYGSLGDVIPKTESIVMSYGGNAMMKVKVAQRFSIMPWRFVSPVATGKAIFITNTNGLSCKDMGGNTAQFYMN